MGTMDRLCFSAFRFSRLCGAAFAALCLIVLSISPATAQSCGQIISALRSLENNQALAAYNNNAQQLGNWQREVSQAESQWVRLGCQSLQNSGQQLSGQCNAIGQTITLARSQASQYQSLASQGQGLARQRDQLVQDFRRFGCDSQSNVNFSNGQRGTLLNDIFGGGTDYINSPYDNAWSSQSTRRTVCVRTTDGFYWPISFSTTDDYIAQDAIRCHEMCPNAQVALFSYRNPGENPEDMISLSGQPYRSQPYAFKFRTEVDMASACKTSTGSGIVTLADADGQSRSIIELGDLSIPLPLKDPRGAIAPAVVAEAFYVPLPRPRPNADGTVAATVAQNPAGGSDGMRIVEFGDKPVRIVGPQTPYVPAPAEET